MTAGPAALAACVLLAAVPVGAPAAEPTLDGITVGQPLSAAFAALGSPAAVASSDDGQRFAFRTGETAYTDDDGIVLALDARSGALQIDIDGRVRRFAVGSYSMMAADAELSADAEFSTPGRRSYRLGPRRDLVLGFDPATHRLDRLTYGEPGQLARLGLLPGDPAAKAVVYRAPRPSAAPSPPAAAPGGSRPGVLRLAIDRSGHVAAVDVVLSCGDPAADAAIEAHARGLRYDPARLDGRPIAATVFLEAAP